MMEDWQTQAARKRATQAQSIPPDWLLPPSAASPSRAADRVDDVRDVPRISGKLAELELEITDTLDAAAVLDKLAKREWSALEVATAFCKRAAIAQQLTNCLTEILFDSALERARELDAHLERTGKLLGPLHGLPISLKEQFDIKGVESTMGYVSRIGHVAVEDCEMVKMLMDLGAVVHCRTNIPQTLLSDETVNNVFGRTLNPCNTSLTAGGSSGGEAALLAMRGSIIGVGTDLGGSIRKPASFTGLYSLRPTSRRLPYHGASNTFLGAEQLESVLGPMATSLSSIDTFMKAVVGHQPWLYDAKCVERPWSPLSPPPPREKLCIAIMEHDGLVRCHPPLQAALADMRKALEKAGHEVVEWEALDHAYAQSIVSKIFDADGGEDVRRALGDTGEPILAQVFSSQHPAMSVWDSWQLNQARDAYRQRFLQAYRATAKRANAQTARPIDAIICANAPHLAEKHLDGPRDGGLITYTTVWSLLDLPCTTLPVGKVDATEPRHARPTTLPTPLSKGDRMNAEQYTPERYQNAPIVLQLICPRRFHEDDLLAITAECERSLSAFTTTSA